MLPTHHNHDHSPLNSVTEQDGTATEYGRSIDQPLRMPFGLVIQKDTVQVSIYTGRFLEGQATTQPHPEDRRKASPYYTR